MATTTSYYNLTKPAGTDYADISVINANMDTIDLQMHNNAAAATTAATNASDEYDTATSYAVGDYCIYENVLYECTTATTGSFDATAWTAVKITDLIAALDARITALGG